LDFWASPVDGAVAFLVYALFGMMVRLDLALDRFDAFDLVSLLVRWPSYLMLLSAYLLLLSILLSMWGAIASGFLTIAEVIRGGPRFLFYAASDFRLLLAAGAVGAADMLC